MATGRPPALSAASMASTLALGRKVFSTAKAPADSPAAQEEETSGIILGAPSPAVDARLGPAIAPKAMFWLKSAIADGVLSELKAETGRASSRQPSNCKALV